MRAAGIAALLQPLATMLVLVSAKIASPNCARRCGNISIPYPLGISAGCHREGLKLTCNEAYHPPKLFIDQTGVQVLEISAQNSTLCIDSGVLNFDLVANNTYVEALPQSTWQVPLNGSVYSVLSVRNKLVALGCGFWSQVRSTSENDATVDSNGSKCVPGRPVIPTDGTCLQNGCCLVDFMFDSIEFPIVVYVLGNPITPVNASFTIVESEWWIKKENAMGLQKAVSSDITLDANKGVRHSIPGFPIRTTVSWVLSNGPCAKAKNSTDFGCLSNNTECLDSSREYLSPSGYICQCQDGYGGNPYVRHGCQDINECASPEKYPCFGRCINSVGSYRCTCPQGTTGDPRKENGCASTKSDKTDSSGLATAIGIGSSVSVLVIIFGAFFLRRKLVVWKARKSRNLFFKQNRGLLLQRLVDKDIAERMIFSLEELDKATNKFDEARKLGGGGHGTVYKGILSDQRVVAIKKSKVAVQREIDDFINEIAILSQVNHRNVVKLFGCCLETEVPLLVYEFISNGTLSDHLLVSTPLSLPWKERLRIALETSRSLAYLHSAASISIVHRDIKSANILLDERFTAKVSDFGASRGIPIDQTGVTTGVQGTFGYLDPEYYHTRQLNEKSDVYSFGVLLAELLTRKSPCVQMSSPGVNLTAQFILLVNQDKLFEMLDPQVIQEGGEEAKEVAAVAVMCLNLKGEDRPTMRQVETRLEAMQTVVNNAAMEENNANASQDNLSRKYSMEDEFMLSMSFPR